jgi:hypothetical protein
MAIKKPELYSSLWASCDELRGGMDASQGYSPVDEEDFDNILLYEKDCNSLV